MARALQPVADVFESLGTQLILSLQALAWMIRPPYRLSQLFAAMDFIGVQSVFIVSLTGVFSGMVLALQTVNSLRTFGAEGVVGSVVAISLTSRSTRWSPWA
jgi:phospholipid/cholesterol/gamma-HCH transport system permease protein